MLGKDLKMHKVGLAILMFAILWSVLSVGNAQAAASKYTGGLLDGQPIEISSTVGQSSGTTKTELTDNDTTNRAYLDQANIAWYKFSSPQDISSYIYYGSTDLEVRFYDSNNNLLLSSKAYKNDAIQSLPSTVKDVSMVVLFSNTGIYVREWNVFSSAPIAPEASSISWIQAGDTVVTLDWVATGAKAYNVKRASSITGPFTLIASNLSDLTYTDTSVTNGSTYFYIVTGVNEFGESADSPAKEIKPEATQYTGGLLDGKSINLGSSVGITNSKVRVMTDNNIDVNSSVLVYANELAWYTFGSPKDIVAMVVNSSTVRAEFYDEANNLLFSYQPLANTGIQSFPAKVNNVKTVVLKSVGEYARVREWNVFESPSKSPLVPSISWIQGGDKIVNIEWASTGAKTYNVKRSTSVGGPYALIANNITGTSYQDKSVINGTKYYYVITASNEAGESDISAAREITPNATKYTGGLLDSLTLNQGVTVGNTTATERKMTDNDTITYGRIIDKTINTWYTFASPKEITSVIINSKGTAKVEFYDENNNLLSTYEPVQNDVVELLPAVIRNVKTVVLKLTSDTINVYEWNVFGSGGELPTQTPQNLTAAAGDKKVTLNWSSVQDVTSYNLKRSTTAGGPYTTVGTVSGAVTSYTDTNVVNGTTYYYVVTAVGTAGESARSNEASATPKASEEVEPPVVTPPVEVPDDGSYGNRALLSIVLINGLEKEYDLSMAEVNAFIAWYEGRAAGTGTMMYSFDKYDNNKGPFKNRRDYVFYDKILFFEVNGYDAPSNGNGSEVTPNPEEH